MFSPLIVRSTYNIFSIDFIYIQKTFYNVKSCFLGIKRFVPCNHPLRLRFFQLNQPNQLLNLICNIIVIIQSLLTDLQVSVPYLKIILEFCNNNELSALSYRLEHILACDDHETLITTEENREL